MNSEAVKQYETMPMDCILVLGDIIRDITYTDGSILFLWVSPSLQSEAMTVLKELGFEYKIKMYWDNQEVQEWDTDLEKQLKNCGLG